MKKPSPPAPYFDPLSGLIGRRVRIRVRHTEDAPATEFAGIYKGTVLVGRSYFVSLATDLGDHYAATSRLAEITEAPR